MPEELLMLFGHLAFSTWFIYTPEHVICTAPYPCDNLCDSLQERVIEGTAGKTNVPREKAVTLEVQFSTGGRAGHADAAPVRGLPHTAELAKASQKPGRWCCFCVVAVPEGVRQRTFVEYSSSEQGLYLSIYFRYSFII